VTQPYDSKSQGGFDDGMPTNPGHEMTVVLLTYNCAHRIVPVVEHLVALQLPIVAVDNGSQDDTAGVLASFEQVELVRLPENIGAAGRNAGVDRVHTPYVLFCDDDGWYEPDGLPVVCDLFERHPGLALINAKILVGEEQRLDPISLEMAESPVPDRHGLPGAVLLSFMAGAVAVRTVAYKEVGGYDPRFFIGGEEETLSFKLAKAGHQMRYVPELVMHHYPSLANAGNLRAYGMRNTLVNAWLHRPLRSALRWTVFTLADTPKNLDFVRGVALTMRAASWIVSERAPMGPQLDGDLALLDARRFANRRSVFTRKGWRPEVGREPVPAD
jgi:N-acetylglucosaminyl-diphospho-decaprenol L-rhamnosyltransferase